MLPPSKRADGLRRLRRDRDFRAGDRPDDRRLADRQLRLADDLLHQPGARRGDAGGADLRPAAIAPQLGLLRQRRLAGYRADGGRARRAADRAGRRQRLRLVRLAVHRQAEPGRGGGAGAFIVVELRREQPLVGFRLLGRRNFGFGTMGNFLLGFALYGSAYLLPQYLAVAQGFDPQQIGEVMAWTGLPQL